MNLKSDLHIIHKTASAFAAKHGFRLSRTHLGTYLLLGPDGAPADYPHVGRATAAGAILMMRHHLLHKINIGRERDLSKPLKRAVTKADRRPLGA